MSKVESYRETLRQTSEWEEFLLGESRLPGPRANIELAQAAAEEGEAEWFEHLLSYDASNAPTNSPYEFLAFCGVLGQGKLLENGHLEALETLRVCASDARWRIREAVAMALQRLGRSDMESLIAEMTLWSEGSLLERRAAGAGLCEPGLLNEIEIGQRVLQILDSITSSILDESNRRSVDFKTLSKALGYCWSVVVAAQPEIGKPFMEKWMVIEDPDVRRIMKNNLKKKRLLRADPEWTEAWVDYFK
jgi:hypothetical protein